jgi:holliday junction DNA helicase RuvA
MIGRLIGSVAHEEPTGAVLIDVRGVGYDLLCPVGTVARAERVRSGDGEQVVLHVHTNVRQDALELFGFSAPEERTAFRLLITVPNVGPRLALSVLNVLTADELVSVIDAEDKARLSKVPGIGKKTAERLVLELRGKLPQSGRFASKHAASSGVDASLSSRLVAALTGLGYRPAEAEKAATALAPRDGSGDLAALLREALKYLAS